MGQVVETVSPIAVDVRAPQQASPTYLTGTLTIDDTDDHDFKVDGRGKSKMTVSVENPGDQTLTIQVYGMHAISGVGSNPAEVGVHQIGGDWTVTDAEDRDYVTVADPFPFYLIRVTPAAGATGDPTGTVHVNFHSGA